MSLRAYVRMPSLLVGFDFHAASTRALGHAVAMLERGCASQIHVVHVLPEPRAHDELLLHAVPTAIEEVTRGMAVRGALARPAWAHVRAGSVHSRIRELALELGADMVVLGARPRSAREPEPYADVSVLVAGAGLELESRLGGAPPCPECEAARATREATWPWCRAHRPLGVAPPRRIDREGALELASSRVMH